MKDREAIYADHPVKIDSARFIRGNVFVHYLEMVSISSLPS